MTARAALRLAGTLAASSKGTGGALAAPAPLARAAAAIITSLQHPLGGVVHNKRCATGARASTSGGADDEYTNAFEEATSTHHVDAGGRRRVSIPRSLGELSPPFPIQGELGINGTLFPTKLPKQANSHLDVHPVCLQ